MPELIPAILDSITTGTCVQPPSGSMDAPQGYSIQRAGVEGMASAMCESGVKAELLNPSRRALVTAQAVWPYEPFSMW